MIKKFFTSWRAVPLHLLIVLLLSYLFINYFFNSYLPDITRHGYEITVPNLENLPIDEAKVLLEDSSLVFIIKDTNYSELHKFGHIITHNPKAGSKVKPDRRSYVTLNAVKAQPTTSNASNINEIKSQGIENIEINLRKHNLNLGKIIELPNEDLAGYIKSLSINGHALKNDTTIPQGSIIDIEVYLDSTDISKDTISTSSTLLGEESVL